MKAGPVRGGRQRPLGSNFLAALVLDPRKLTNIPGVKRLIRLILGRIEPLTITSIPELFGKRLPGTWRGLRKERLDFVAARAIRGFDLHVVTIESG